MLNDYIILAMTLFIFSKSELYRICITYSDKIIRTLLYVLIMLHILIINTLLLFVIIIEYPFDNSYAFSCMKTLYYITEKIFFSSDIIYRDLILPTESYIFMPNHQSFLDGILTFLIPNKIVGIVIGYVAKIPIIGQVAKMLGFIFVYKTGGVVNMAVQKLKNNVDTSLIIFPEGARFFDGVFHPEKLRTGGFHIASQLKYKIVPIYLTFGNVLDDVNKKYNYDANSIIIVGKIIDTRNKDIATIMSEYCEEMTRLEHMAKTHIYL